MTEITLPCLCLCSITNIKTPAAPWTKREEKRAHRKTQYHISGKKATKQKVSISEEVCLVQNKENYTNIVWVIIQTQTHAQYSYLIIHFIVHYNNSFHCTLFLHWPFLEILCSLLSTIFLFFIVNQRTLFKIGGIYIW